MADQTWVDKMATALTDERDVNHPPNKAEIICALEAVAEMKTVKLKVLLGRCYEVLRVAEDISLDEDFLSDIFNACL